MKSTKRASSAPRRCLRVVARHYPRRSTLPRTVPKTLLDTTKDARHYQGRYRRHYSPLPETLATTKDTSKVARHYQGRYQRHYSPLPKTLATTKDTKVARHHQRSRGSTPPKTAERVPMKSTKRASSVPRRCLRVVFFGNMYTSDLSSSPAANERVLDTPMESVRHTNASPGCKCEGVRRTNASVRHTESSFRHNCVTFLKRGGA